MKKKITIAWFSAGVSSFVASYLIKSEIDKIVYCHIDNQHPDSLRFLKDAEKILDKEIEIIQSEYKDIITVIKKFQFINSAYGAKCTDVLKKRVRKDYEQKYKDYDITQVWGFDIEERHRADRIIESMPEYSHRFPLIERNLSKKDCHELSRRLGLKRPQMYDLGYANNNCVGCVKGGMGYWNKIRIDFPETFKQMAITERVVGHSCIKDCFLDELDPERGNMSAEIFPECSFFCEILP